MKKWIPYLIILFFAFSLINLNAQNTYLKTWIGASYEQKVKLKDFKFKVSLRQQLRVSDLVYNPKINTFTELKVSKKITDFYSFGVAYRINYLNGIRHRASLSNSFKIDLKPVTVAFRLKYQAEIEKHEPFSQDFRLKTTVKYAANKDYRPYVFGEILYNHKYNFSNFNQYRVGFGVDADYKKKHQFDVMLMYTEEFNVERPDAYIVLGLFYTFAKK